MENTSTSTSTSTAEAKTKRRRLTPEEKRAREAAYAEYKAGVAKRAEREAEYEARRKVELDLSVLNSAVEMLKTKNDANVKDLRSAISSVLTAAQNLEKQTFHHSVNTKFTIKV